MMNRLIILLLVLSLGSCKPSENAILNLGPTGDSVMVVSAHPSASAVGMMILRKKGSVVDAGIAVQFALAVVYPAAGNLGGGGFMLLRQKDGKNTSLDYRETAPSLANEKMYLDATGNPIPDQSIAGHLSCGTPGSVAGLFEAHQKFGKLPWAELVQPAIDLATSGVILTEKEASGLNGIQASLKKYNTIIPSQFIKDNWKAGDTLRQPELAETLIRIRDHGRDGFYKGKTAEDIVAECKRGKGIITFNDLEKYEPKWREPIKSTYRGYTVITMSPPSSGGIALAQLLKSVEPFPMEEYGFNTYQSIHLMTEAERRAFADRAAYLGDPDFIKVPVDQLLNDLYIKERMSSFNPEKATASRDMKEGTFESVESHHTTHISIADAEGNAVSITTTLNDNYGSKVVVAGSGFLLNDEMDDFSIKPGLPNMYGAVGGEANKIEPEKRMLSSMTPTILEKDGKLFMVVGTPGGTCIITGVFQAIVNVIDHHMTMQEAVSAARTHSQWLPDELYVENGSLDSTTIQALRELGHRVKSWEDICRVDGILLTNGKLEGGADPRGDDKAAGY